VIVTHYFIGIFPHSVFIEKILQSKLIFVCYSIAFVHCTTINKSRLFAKQCKCFVYTCIVDATDVHLQTGSPQHGSQRLHVILLDIVQKHQLVREPDSFGFLLFRILLGVKTGTATHYKSATSALIFSARLLQSSLKS